MAERWHTRRLVGMYSKNAFVVSSCACPSVMTSHSRANRDLEVIPTTDQARSRYATVIGDPKRLQKNITWNFRIWSRNSSSANFISG